MQQQQPTTESGSAALMSQKKGPCNKAHPVRLYVERVASQDLGDYPEWDLEKPLPKLPVPELTETMNRYLLCIRPIVYNDQYERTRHLVDEFQQPGGMGEQLQSRLKEYAETVDNWVYQFWLDDMYMRVRLAVPINSNPGMVFPRQHFADQSEQLRYAARFVSGILDYKVIIDSRLLPMDRARSREPGQPLCMDQYYRLFTSYRYPGVEQDSLVTTYTSGDEAEHIIVACKNQFFVLDVVVNSIRLSDDNIYAQLKRIVQMAEEGQAKGHVDQIGILTAGKRNVWASARRVLAQDETNQENLEAIECCMFVLCLDNSTPATLFSRSPDGATTTDGLRRDDVSLAEQMMHGHGSRVNSGNRWFDKTMQFVIAEDGACGLCYEHSASEGIAVVQLIEHLLAYMEELRRRKLPRMQSLCDLAQPRRLQWNVVETVRRDIAQVAESFDRLVDDCNLYVLRFNDYGKEFPKSQNMSPDAYIQLALQLTYYKVHGRLVSTYESASIRRFRLGRVDNIRACSLEALAWCKAMVSASSTSVEEKVKLLRQAIKRQTDILVQTILGHGIDNHLLGLREIAGQCAMSTPQLFRDESYVTSNHFTLSTSQVPTTMDAFMCYGPVVDDGYGVCYNPHPDYMVVCVASFRSWPGTDSQLFCERLVESLRQMRELCTGDTVNGGSDRRTQ